MKKKIIIVTSIILLFFITLLIFQSANSKNLIELNCNEVIKKMNNKESFVLCISQTTCSHCFDYKPKLKEIVNTYNINIYFIDIDKCSDLEKEKFINYISFDGSTPVTVFIKNGEEKTTANRINGDVSKSKIIDKFKINGIIK